MFVADGTRPDTVAAAGAIRESARETIGDVPAVLVLNKWDLRDHWRVDHEALLATGWQGSPALLSSAKSGEGVEDAFTKLVRQDAAI
jgi:signal recognition particle receptor subunit beta